MTRDKVASEIARRMARTMRLPSTLSHDAPRAEHGTGTRNWVSGWGGRRKRGDVVTTVPIRRGSGKGSRGPRFKGKPPVGKGI